MGVALLNVTQSAPHAQALQFHRKAHKAGGHQGKRIHTRDCWCFLPGNTSLRYTTTAQFIIIAFRFRRVLFSVATATTQMLSINSEVKKEH